MGQFLRNPAPHALLSAIEGNLIECFLNFGRVPQAELHENDGALWFSTGLPAAPYNVVLRTQWADDIDARVGRMLAYYQQRQTPLAWFVTPFTQPASLTHHLATHGLAVAEKLTGMAVNLDTLPAPALRSPDITIQRVSDEAAMRTFVKLLMHRWQLSPALSDTLYAWHSAIAFRPDSPGHYWLAFHNHVPVAKAFLYLGAGVAGIYGVYTLPEARGLGIARAMTLTAYRAARALGCRIGVLDSTEVAVNLYRQIGFVEQCPIHIYASADSAHSN